LREFTGFYELRRYQTRLGRRVEWVRYNDLVHGEPWLGAQVAG